MAFAESSHLLAWPNSQSTKNAVQPSSKETIFFRNGSNIKKATYLSRRESFLSSKDTYLSSRDIYLSKSTKYCRKRRLIFLCVRDLNPIAITLIFKGKPILPMISL